MAMEPLVLPTSRRRGWLLLIASLVFVVGSVFVIREGEVVAGWICLVFSGVCSLFLTTFVIPGLSFLRLDSDGFTVKAGFSERTTAWTEVSEFVAGPRPMPFGRVMRVISFPQTFGLEKNEINGVFFDYLREGRPSGAKGQLIDAYEMPPSELAALMNEWRQRALARAPTPPVAVQ
jgi:hypothetical protein